MVREMLARGVDHDVIVIAVEAAETVAAGRNSTEIPRNSSEEILEKRRAKDRERKVNSKEIPRNSTEFHGNEKSASIIDIKKVSSKRGERLSVEWAPSAEDRAFAKQLGWSDPQIDREGENFRDYWAAVPGAKGTKLDWPATWRKWIRDSRTKPAGPTILAQPSPTDWRAIMDSHKRFKHWPKGHGNEPGMPGCRVPQELLREFGFEPPMKGMQ